MNALHPTRTLSVVTGVPLSKEFMAPLHGYSIGVSEPGSALEDIVQRNPHVVVVSEDATPEQAAELLQGMSASGCGALVILPKGFLDVESVRSALMQDMLYATPRGHPRDVARFIKKAMRAVDVWRASVRAFRRHKQDSAVLREHAAAKV